MPENSAVDLIVHAEHIPGNGRTGLGVEQLQGLALQIVQGNLILLAKGQLLLHVQLLGAVVEQRRHPGLVHIGAVALRQADGLLLRPQDMGDALVLKIAQGHRPQLLQRQVLEIRLGAVKALPQDIAVDGRGQFMLAAALSQPLPQLRGGDIHHPRNSQCKDTRAGVGAVEIVPLDGKELLGVLFGATEGSDARQGQDGLRVMPGLEGEEHIRSHQQPQLIVGVLFPQLSQGVGGVALPLSSELQVQYLHLVPQTDLLPRQAGHFAALLRGGAARRQHLVGRQLGRNEKELVQLQQLKHGPGRRDVSQMGRIKGPAINADLHGIPSSAMDFWSAGSAQMGFGASPSAPGFTSSFSSPLPVRSSAWQCWCFDDTIRILSPRTASSTPGAPSFHLTGPE